VGQGNYYPASSTSEAFRWSQAGGMVGLGDLPGGLFYSVALAVSSDGSVVVGYGNSALGFEASRWTLADGMRSLRQVLVNDYGLGSSLTGWGLSQATGVSGDGKVIVGSGTNPGGQQEAWIANLRVATLSSTPGNGATLSFGNVLVGSSATRSLSVTNAGDQYTTLAGTFPAGGGRFAPGSTQGFSLAQGAGTSRDYTYTPLARGTDNLDVTITSDGGISGEDATITLWGRGVAPQQQTVLLNNAGLVRIGTSGSARISVTNVGDGNLSGLGVVSNLRGNVALVPGSPPEFTGGTPVDLADGASQTFTYTYTPTGHGPQQATVRADFLNGSDDGRNLAQILDQIITGTGVGPVFASSVAPGGTIGFGDIILGGAGTRTLQISNESTDGVFVNALTGLTLVSYGFGGPDAAAFSLPLFGPGSVVGEGGVLDVEIQLDGTAPLGPKSATLTFTTNQGAAFGGNGQQFMWDLTGNVIEPSYAIPEPTTLGLLGLALAALARRRWRKLPRQ
jgi:hypothetical protein